MGKEPWENWKPRITEQQLSGRPTPVEIEAFAKELLDVELTPEQMRLVEHMFPFIDPTHNPYRVGSEAWHKYILGLEQRSIGQVEKLEINDNGLLITGWFYDEVPQSMADWHVDWESNEAVLHDPVRTGLGLSVRQKGSTVLWRAIYIGLIGWDWVVGSWGYEQKGKHRR